MSLSAWKPKAPAGPDSMLSDRLAAAQREKVPRSQVHSTLHRSAVR